MDTLELLTFLEKNSIHNNASNYYDEKDNEKIVYEIALELEEKYHVVSKFLEKYKDDISFFIAKEKSYVLLHPEKSDNSNIVIANHIKGLWLDFMEKGEHGIMTIRAKKRVRWDLLTQANIIKVWKLITTAKAVMKDLIILIKGF